MSTPTRTLAVKAIDVLGNNTVVRCLCGHAFLVTTMHHHTNGRTCPACEAVVVRAVPIDGKPGKLASRIEFKLAVDGWIAA